MPVTFSESVFKPVLDSLLSHVRIVSGCPPEGNESETQVFHVDQEGCGGFDAEKIGPYWASQHRKVSL